jgi:hypothetical protein
LIEPYILILLAVILAVSHFAVFRLVFDDDFEARFKVYQDRQRNQLMRENEEFVSSMQNVMELDPESVEASGFGAKWRHKLASIDEVVERRRELEGKVHITYYVLIGSVLTSAAALSVPDGVPLPFNTVLYVTSFSWWLLLGALLWMMWLLLRYQMVNGELNKTGFDDRRGIRIGSGENIVSRLFSRLSEALGR